MARGDFEGQEGGGGLTDFEFTVTEAYFASDPRYAEAGGGDVLFLHLIGKSDAEGHELMGRDDFHPSFTLAEHWTTVDGGKTVTSSKSGSPKMGKWYGKFCTRAVELTEPVAEQDSDPLRGDNHPSDSSIWIGTKWFFENETTDFGGNIGKRDHLMPTRYLGMENVSTPAAAPVAAPAAPAGGLRDQVVALAKASANYQAFQSAALQLPGVSSDMALLQAVADENNGIWAEAQS